MKQHKWAKEIKAWADGATIQFSSEFGVWIDIENNVQPEWNKYTEYRIKPQPKEPQYLYVWKDGQHHITFTTNPPFPAQNTWDIKLIGKIKLETDDE
jgi:hypothetical protein